MTMMVQTERKKNNNAKVMQIIENIIHIDQKKEYISAAQKNIL